ncbi:MAG: hypothetical protein R6U43_04855 [Candidatus Krumholzibacteriales bacterium]
MFRRTLLPAIIVIFLNAATPQASLSDVVTVDFLDDMKINAAGPFLLRIDESRNRLIAANTLSSSISVIDCESETVRNIPIGGRGLQHLKSESLALDPVTGSICLIGDGRFHIIDPASGEVTDIETEHQYESAVICSGTGNVFLTGRETGRLGFFSSSTGRFSELDWLDRSEPLVNMNATPPPPIRKVVYDRQLSLVIAVDGYSSTIHTFDPATGRKLSERELNVEPRSRWHLAGYDRQRHALHMVLETGGRKVTEAVLVDINGGNDIITPLPGLTEGAGICFNPERNELYISYDNHPTVHVVDYNRQAEISLIKIPAYGNDAAAVDRERGLLYIASWAHGEIDVIDLEKRALAKRIMDLGIIPHMFSMAFSHRMNRIYFPRGATAVNGTFGSAVTVLDPGSGESWKIRTGWCPMDMIRLKQEDSFLVFSSEDMVARISPGGQPDIYKLPFDFPIKAAHSPSGGIYLSYGPHQSYWPTVYIWGARNGVLGIEPETMEFYDRRIPRQGMDIALDGEGILYLTQNNWGRENQFITRLLDEVRLFEPARRLVLPDTVQRETTQRVLEYDPKEGLLYLLKAGEKESGRSSVHIVDPDSGAETGKAYAGINGTGLVFDSDFIYVTNFGSGSITAVRKSDRDTTTIPAGGSPLRSCLGEDKLYVIDHTGNRLLVLEKNSAGQLLSGRAEAGDILKSYNIPFSGMPDNILYSGGGPVITSHSGSRLAVLRFDPVDESFETLMEYDYPFGDVSLAGSNSSFYMSGQFGDAVFSLNRIAADSRNRLWITDFLAGKLFILED